MPSSGRIKWAYIAIPDTMKKQIDEIVKANKYPEGLWHSRGHYVVEKLKVVVSEDLEKLKKLEQK